MWLIFFPSLFNNAPINISVGVEAIKEFKNTQGK